MVENEILQHDERLLALFLYLLLSLVRIGVFAFTIPPMLGRAVPLRLRLAIVLLLGLLVSFLNMDSATVISRPLIVLLQEVIVGFAFGFAVSSILLAFQVAGRLVERLTGGSLVSSGAGDFGSPVVLFYVGIATSLFFVSGAHRIVMDAILESFTRLPVGQEWIMPSQNAVLSELLGTSFEFALRIAAPIALTLVAASVILAVAARFVRTFNFFSIGLSLNAFLTLAGLVVTCGLLPMLFESHFTAVFDIASEFVRAIRI